MSAPPTSDAEKPPPLEEIARAAGTGFGQLLKLGEEFVKGLIGSKPPRPRTHLRVTADERDAMLRKQGGVCAICGRKPETGPLEVDHDHATDINRELLCGKCNRAIGLFDEDTSRMQSAIDYIERHREGSRERSHDRPRVPE